MTDSHALIVFYMGERIKNFEERTNMYKNIISNLELKIQYLKSREEVMKCAECLQEFENPNQLKSHFCIVSELQGMSY